MPEIIQHKVCELRDIKLFDAVTEGDNPTPYGSFEGYGSIFNNVDSQGEIVLPGAFKDTINEFKRDGFIAIGHKWDGLPVATITDAYEDELGLYIKADFHSTPEAQAARTVIQERLARGKSAKMSIGYRVLQAAKSEAGKLLKKLQLFEVSLVTVPANPAALVLGAKSINEVVEPIMLNDNSLEVEISETEDLNSLLAGQTFQKHYDTVLAAVEVLSNRTKSIRDLRVKEGRQLSRANYARVESIIERTVSLTDDLRAILGTPKSDEEIQPTETVGGSELVEVIPNELKSDGEATEDKTETPAVTDPITAETDTKSAEVAELVKQQQAIFLRSLASDLGLDVD